MPKNQITDNDPRLLIAATYVMKHQQGISDDGEATYTIDEMRAFIARCDRRQRRLLRKIANDIADNGPVLIQ